jgi:hypothetical protein
VVVGALPSHSQGGPPFITGDPGTPGNRQWEINLPVEATAKWGPASFNGEVGRWIGNRNVPSRWERGLIAGHEFNVRLEFYAKIYDL